MGKNSDDIPTRVVKRPTVPGLRFGDPQPADEQPTRVVRGNIDLDAEQVVTRRIPRPDRKPEGPATAEPSASVTPSETELPAGWITVVNGPGRGRFLPVFVGMNSLGRDKTNRLPVDFGDDMISRTDHAFIIFDDEQRSFWVQHGGKSNLLRVNGVPVMAPTPLGNGDVVRIGSTEFRFTAFCDANFSWTPRP